MIAYRKTNGKAHDIRFVADDYVAIEGEFLIEGDELPTVEDLSDPPTQAELDAAAALAARLAEDEAERQAAKVDGAILSLVNATPAQLVVWARNNFPSLTLAEQNRIGMILNILAVSVRPRVR